MEIPKLSIIITARREKQTIRRAIEAFLSQMMSLKYELLVVSPDQGTLKMARQYGKDSHVKAVEDADRGKPSALNQAFKLARGVIVILSDGDVFIEQNAIGELLELLKDEKVGIVSGRPVSLNSKNTILGYWSHLLTDVADKIRKERADRGKFIDCSGYLLALRRKLVDRVPPRALAEDALISQLVWQRGFLTAYAPEAKVFVKYPTHYRDWLRQKIRSAGGTQQVFWKDVPKMRSFNQEVRNIWRVFSYPKTAKEFFWTILLLLARIDLWLRILLRVKIQKESRRKLWVRVESTK